MKFNNLKKLPEILAFMDDDNNHWQQKAETYLPAFKSDICIEALYYPSSFQGSDLIETQENLKKLNAKDIYDPFEKAFLVPADLEFLSDEQKAEDEEYCVFMIYFDVLPVPKIRDLRKFQSLNFYLINSYYDDGSTKIHIFYNDWPYNSNFENIANAKLLSEDPDDENEKYYLQVLLDAIEAICGEFKIATDENQGIFVEKMKKEPEKLLDDFLEITHAKDFQDEDAILEFKRNWKDIQENPEEYRDTLVDEDYLDEDEEIDSCSLYQYLLSQFLFTFDTDWKMEHEDLSEFISGEIQQDFKITFEETQQNPCIISEKIEKESDYTLLNIDTQGDSYSFFVCKKDEKAKILELAKKLSFPVEGY